MAVQIHIDRLLVDRGLSVGEFADAIGITPTNVAVLKNGRARAVRFTTLDAICRVLNCQPGDVLSWTPDETSSSAEGLDT
ncbi:MAG TPA: helix-turn-helix transcriptional regulator [Humibacter sp.]|nr:helix-turn-helix transcriptional regulator [Humibacter sp.]